MNAIEKHHARGKKTIETKREHIPIQLFKQAAMLNNQLTQIQFTMSNIGHLNAGKKRDVALKMLNDWFPQASSFMAQIKKLENEMQETKSENKKLSSEILNVYETAKQQAELIYEPKIENLQQENEKQFEESQVLFYELQKLKASNEFYQAFIDTLPNEIKAET